MTKGKFGLSTAAIAIIAFGFCALRQPQSVLLVTGFALLAERDEWLNKQALQALLLTIIYYLTTLVTDWTFGGLGRVLGFFGAYAAQDGMFQVNSLVGSAVYIALVIFSVLAVIRIYQGKDAGLPWLSKLAGGDFTEALRKAPKPEYSQVQHVQPIYTAQQYEPTPQIPVQPVTQTYTQAKAKQDVPSALVCLSCGAPMQAESRFCTVCGAKKQVT